MNICVIGAGAIGGWISAKLAASGCAVCAFTSRGPVDHLVIREGEAVQSVDLAPFEGRADLAIIAVKAVSLESAAEAAVPLIDERTVILPMLNGVPWWFVEDQSLKSVDPSGKIARSLPFSQLVGCVVHASCYRAGPNEIVVNHSDKIILGEPCGGSSARISSLCEIFSSAGISAQANDNVRRAIWYKLWGNATINPLSALTRASSDRILNEPECRSWMLQGMMELAKVGASIGCPISESGEERMAVTARLGAFKTSMLQDVENSRPIELEALLGAPREIARRHGIETPALDRLYGVTRLMAANLGLI